LVRDQHRVLKMHWCTTMLEPHVEHCRAVSDDKSPQLVRVHMHACRFARWGKRTTPCRL
jgi:hypothetical protein